MVVNQSRSMNGELAEGATDSRYKKVVTERGGQVDPSTYAAREDLASLFYGIHEARSKELGDGTRGVTTPGYVHTSPPTGFMDI